MPVQFYPEEMAGEEQWARDPSVDRRAGCVMPPPRSNGSGLKEHHLFLVFPTTGCQEEKTSQTPLLGLGIVWNG